MRRKARSQLSLSLQALLLEFGMVCGLKLSLPGSQYDLIKRTVGFFSHGVAPNLVIALLWLALGNDFEGLPINSEYR